MDKKDIIVIGASAGGFEAIKTLAAELPPGMDASIFIVWHMAPDVLGILPQVLNRKETLFAANAVDMEPIKPGRIYIAPPDHHMLLVKGCVRVSRGPKENRFRPAVDPLFRSAAYHYGARVVGIILSGALDDGTAGLWMIKKYGGTAVIQSPADAEVPSMPENAKRAVKVDYEVPVAGMATLLTRLAQEPATTGIKAGEHEDTRTKHEINIAMDDKSTHSDILRLGELTSYTCPECHGVLSALNEGDRVRFRCHTGHAFSADSLLATITESIEDSIWTALRYVRESVMLLNHMGDHFAEINKPRLAAMYFKKASSAENRVQLLRKVVMTHEQLNAGSIQQEADLNGKGNGQTS